MASPSSSSSSGDSSYRSNSLTSNYSTDTKTTYFSQPRTSMTRKRAASLMDDEGGGELRIGGRGSGTDREVSLGLGGARTGIVDTGRVELAGILGMEQVCLCQPEPKIPRPRNAFILYRQYMQAQVVAQNPGLANPEISKIIGEQWKKQSVEVKDDWKQLAEEEKQRHQRQYPGYRYQPKRADKNSSPVNATSPLETTQTCCTKCHRRYIFTPSTPITPFAPNTMYANRVSATASSPLMRTIGEQTRQIFEDGRVSASRTLLPPQHRRQSSLHRSQIHYEMPQETETMSPGYDPKRRRLDNKRLTSVWSSSGYLPHPHDFSGHNSVDYLQTPVSSVSHKASTLPFSHRPSETQAFQYPRPQQELPTCLPILPTINPPHYNDSLRLPPLQTQLAVQSKFTQTSLPTPFAHRHSVVFAAGDNMKSQEKTAENTMMDISFMEKIKILSQISPHLALSSPTSGNPTSTSAGRGCVIAVEGMDEKLSWAIGDYLKELLGADEGCDVKSWDTESLAASLTASPTTETQDGYVEYHYLMIRMRIISSEIKKHIVSDSQSKPSATIHTTPTTVALLPRSFSLTLSSKYASLTPITDSYAPFDHWQWMATSWRGIIGPDLIVYCMRSTSDDIERFGVLEVREEGGQVIFIVMVEEDMDNCGASIDDRTKGKLAFEVGEFVRGWRG